MSGLAALFHRDGRPVDPRVVSEMVNAAAYRGPDGSRVCHFGAVGLGHARMVVTIEEVDEWQPLISNRTGAALIADVRLDNRDELLARIPDRVSSTASDAELILRGYEAWGADVALRLLGDFAFVLWDPRLQHLVCARDTSGQRSLFYRCDDRTFAAASEIHQLLQDPDVPLRPNEDQLREYLVPLNVTRNLKDQAATFYEGILAVPAGHVLIVDRERLSLRQYWDLRARAELRYRSDEEYAEHYLELFSESVQARLRSIHPVGVMLSGGLDSSSVACVAQELYRSGAAADRGFTSISFVFDDLECDEQPFIRDVQAKYGFDARYVPCPPFAGWLQPEPLGFQELPNMSLPGLREAVYGAATDAGVRVLLNGDVGDTCVAGGALVFDRLLAGGRLRELARRLRAYRRTSRESLRKILALYCIAPLLPLPLQRQLVSLQVRRAFARNAPNLLPFWMPDVLRAELAQRHLALQLEAEKRRRFSNPVRESEARMLFPPELCQQPMPWSLQFWRPFADRRLQEFLLAIPPQQKYAPHPETDDYYAASKRLVRRAMQGIVPESIRTRTSKTHFGSVFDSAVARQWPLYVATFGPEAGRKSEIARRGYVDPDRFWARLNWLLAGQDFGDFMYVLRIVGLEMWLRGLNLPRSQAASVRRPLPRVDSTSLDVSNAALVPVAAT